MKLFARELLYVARSYIDYIHIFYVTENKNKNHQNTQICVNGAPIFSDIFLSSKIIIGDFTVAQVFNVKLMRFTLAHTVLTRKLKSEYISCLYVRIKMMLTYWEEAYIL